MCLGILQEAKETVIMVLWYFAVRGKTQKRFYCMVRFKNDNLDLTAIADSGQCFRWKETEDGYRVIAFGKVLYISSDPETKEICLDCSEQEFEEIWREYLDIDTDYAEIIGRIPETDLYLKAAAECGCGIRILRQDPWETLITFIISQRKNIPAIKQAVEKICAAAGQPIGCCKGEKLYAFPFPAELASLSLEDLTKCSLGYRAKYIQATADAFANGGASTEALAAMSDDDLFNALCSFYGVGKKVAFCTMLFGFHRMDSFPMDVWMNRVAEKRYSGEIPMEHYSPWGGVMQQYMFAYERKLAMDGEE